MDVEGETSPQMLDFDLTKIDTLKETPIPTSALVKATTLQGQNKIWSNYKIHTTIYSTNSDIRNYNQNEKRTNHLLSSSLASKINIQDRKRKFEQDCSECKDYGNPLQILNKFMKGMFGEKLLNSSVPKVCNGCTTLQFFHKFHKVIKPTFNPSDH